MSVLFDRFDFTLIVRDRFFFDKFYSKKLLALHYFVSYDFQNYSVFFLKITNIA